jgi:hypothetical protein
MAVAPSPGGHRSGAGDEDCGGANGDHGEELSKDETEVKR